MPTKILVPLDGSRLAEQALAPAESIAQATRARLVLVRAVPARALPIPGSSGDEGLRAAEHYLDHVRDGLQADGYLTEPPVVGDLASAGMDAAEWILEQARARRADMIVMATRGRSGVGRVFYGSVASGVLAESPVPVLLVRAGDTEAALFPPRPRVVVPLDGTPFSEEALPIAADLAAALRGELVLVRAVPPVTQARGRAIVYAATQHSLLKKEAGEYLDAVAGRLPLPREAVRPDVRGEEPTAAIVRSAEEHDAAMVVMATRARTGLERAWIGSVADGVVRDGGLPVLLVRPAETEGVSEAASRPGRGMA